MIYPWQETMWQQTVAQVQQDKLPHALLLTAPVGSGKQVFAASLAKYLLCDAGEHSLLEKNRHLFASDAGHPDYHEAAPEGKLNVIKIDHIRELAHDLVQTASQRGYRVVVINQAERMNIAAANALLKTLEEPGDNVVLMLLSSEPEQLLPTIRSRCRVLNLAADATAAHAWLIQQTQDKQLETAWRLSRGAPLKALQLLESKQVDVCLKWVSAVVGKKPIVSLGMQLDKDIPITTYVRWLSYLAADCVRCTQGLTVQTFVTMSAALESFARHFDNQHWYRVLDACCEAMRRAQRPISLNNQLLIEALLIKFYHLNVS